ncbi:MAG TPA: hypothetical protein VIK13_10050, partial [Candidatus Limnocylindrales bacterium]
GYPGFGSHMAWHPATGLGVIGLGNVRYAPVRPVVAEMLAMLVREDVAPRRRVAPTPAVERFRGIAEGLLAGWDDAAADAAFAMNMDLDEPRDLRRAAVERVAADLGPVRPDDGVPAFSASPAHLRWWLRGERGRVQLEILVTPEPEPRIQTLRITPVGEPDPVLRGAAQRILSLGGDVVPAWPSDLPVAVVLDTGAVERALRAGSAVFGTMALGLVIAGDGRTTSTWQLATERGRATLRVDMDAQSGEVTAVELLAAAREPVPDAW